MEYRLVSFRNDAGDAEAGVLIGERVHRAATLLAGAGVDTGSVLGLLRGWDRVRELLAAGRPRPQEGRPLAEMRLLAPILYPGAVFCAGANYWDHMAEMAEVQRRVGATGAIYEYTP